MIEYSFVDSFYIPRCTWESNLGWVFYGNEGTYFKSCPRIMSTLLRHCIAYLQEEERVKEEFERNNPLQPVVGQTVVVARMKREGQVGVFFAVGLSQHPTNLNQSAV